MLMATSTASGRIWMGRVIGSERTKQHGRGDHHNMNFGEMPHRMKYEMRESGESHASDQNFTRKPTALAA